MPPKSIPLLKTMVTMSAALGLLLVVSIFLGLGVGSTGHNFADLLALLTGQGSPDAAMAGIIWNIRLPRVLLAALTGATLSLGGLVFQALLRNPLAEPYILGISGGSAIGAILGILLGLSRFPGVALFAFCGSMVTLFLVLVILPGKSTMGKDSLILAGVMVNALCSSIIMFLVSLTQDSRLHNILFWLMGDLSMSDTHQVATLTVSLVPCYAALFLAARPMNLLLMGEEQAASMGVNVQLVSVVLLVLTSFMVSATVCHSGLLGFVGLVIPHLLRLMLGPDHRLLIPSCILGGASYLVLCDLLARSLPTQGEMPVGVITAMIGAPLFIFLLQRSSR
jgi:iron complex transport system permease protein